MKFLIFFIWASNAYALFESSAKSTKLSWLVNYPDNFHGHSVSLGDSMVLANEKQMGAFDKVIKDSLATVNLAADGEIVDALEQFFWGQTHGLAIELGALDGTPTTQSQTYELEKSLGWKRILVEGNPEYRQALLNKSPQAFSVNAAICAHRGSVHYVEQRYTSGIVEFMDQNFLKRWHPQIYEAGTPHGNISSVQWSEFPKVQEVACIPMHIVLHKANARHVNFFILDVEGAEMEVLKTINWSVVKFDVLCIETNPTHRPPGYMAAVTAFMKERGYKDYAGLVARNTWFVREDFVPSVRPGVTSKYFNGACREAKSAGECMHGY